MLERMFSAVRCHYIIGKTYQRDGKDVWTSICQSEVVVFFKQIKQIQRFSLNIIL